MGLLVVGSVRWDRLKLDLDTLPLIELVDLDNFEMRQSEDFFQFSKNPGDHIGGHVHDSTKEKR